MLRNLFSRSNLFRLPSSPYKGITRLKAAIAAERLEDPRKQLSNLESKPHVIYEGALSAQLKRLKLFSMSTSSMGLLMQPMLISKISEVGKAPIAAALTTICFFTYGTPFLIHLLSKRYITEIIYTPATDKYTAITYSFFLRRKEIQFGVEDIIVPEVPGPLTSFLIKLSDKPGKVIPIFTLDTCFLYLEHYGRFMKFDKPLDLKLANPKSVSKS